MNKTLASLFGIMLSTTAMASDLYVSGSVGTTASGTGQAVVGLALGSEVHKNLRIEGAYQHDPDRQQHNVFVNAMPQAQIPGTSLVPYVLVGVGTDVEHLNSRPLYVVGGGVRVEVTKSVDLDLRYSRIDSVDNNDLREVVSAGISLKF